METELMQYRWSVGVSKPSPSNRCLADGLLLARAAARTETPAADSRHRRGAGADGPDPHPPTRAGSRRAAAAAPAAPAAPAGAAAPAAPAAAEKRGTTDPLVGEDARAR